MLGPGHTKEQSPGKSAPTPQTSARCPGTRLGRTPHSGAQRGSTQESWDPAMYPSPSPASHPCELSTLSAALQLLLETVGPKITKADFQVTGEDPWNLLLRLKTILNTFMSGHSYYHNKITLIEYYFFQLSFTVTLKQRYYYYLHLQQET